MRKQQTHGGTTALVAALATCGPHLRNGLAHGTFIVLADWLAHEAPYVLPKDGF